MTHRSLGIVKLTIPALFFSSALAQSVPDTQVAPQTKPEYSATLRWGRQPPESETTKIVSAISQLFQSHADDLNFSKRGLTNLIEKALPRPLGKLFPFRIRHPIPQQFFFENFAPVAFLVGELNGKVAPILAETETAEWIELQSRESIRPARELHPQQPMAQGLRALALQNPPSSEIFSTAWTKFFDQGAALLEHGGLACQRKAETKNESPSSPLPNHVKCSTPLQTLTKENSIPKQLPRKIGAISAPSNLQSATPEAHPTCLPMGRLNMQTLEFLGDEKGGHCLLWRASKDERFQQRMLSSKLICLNARHKSFQRTRFNSVVAVLPSSRPDVLHIVESEDGLLTSHKLSLSTLSVSKQDVTNTLGQNLRQGAFPQQRTGLYACQQPTTPEPSSFPFAEAPTTTSMEWIYIDDSLYSGLKTVRSETDVAWRIKETNENSIEIERLNWSQLQYDHPSITSDRPFACAAARDMDAKCGLRVLQTALQVSEDWLSGEMERSGLPIQSQFSVALILNQSLEKIMHALPDWALREETQSLNDFFIRKSNALSENQIFASSPPRIERMNKIIPPQRTYLDIPKDSQDYLAIKSLLLSSADFWAVLKQKPL